MWRYPKSSKVCGEFVLFIFCTKLTGEGYYTKFPQFHKIQNLKKFGKFRYLKLPQNMSY